MWRWIRTLFGGASPRAAGPGTDTSVLREEWPVEEARGATIDVAIHPLPSPCVVLMLPGYDGAIDGYAGKYTAIAELLRTRGVGAVVRAGNHVVPGHDFEDGCRFNARALLRGALRRAVAICGRPDPELYLLGMSAGASAFAAVAAEEPRVTKLLLLAPSYDATPEAVDAGLSRFQGELHVVVGANDAVVRDLPAQLVERATAARRRELRVIPDCDHQFRGERNGRVLSHAPLWAFLGDGPGPDPERGVHLYD